MKISYFILFFKLFIINTVTFGGGYTIIPIIKDEFVFKNEYIKEEEIDEIIAFAQSIPGVMTITTSYLLGYKLKGVIGGIISIIASAIPCLLIISFITYFYDVLRENIYLKKIMQGINASIIAILLITVYKMLKNQYKTKNKNIYYIITIFTFLIRYIFKIDIVYILIVISIIGIFLNQEVEKC